MSGQPQRLAAGGDIDRESVLPFTFNGKSYTGFAGDTLASALLANGVAVTARSFRYRRPRGILSAGIEECHAIVSVGEGASIEPNVRATLQPLYAGLVANSQRGWPSVRFDLGAAIGWCSRFLPAGFYYKTFLWPGWRWYAPLIRRLAGVAPVPEGQDPDRYDKRNLHCDLLIVGAGQAGLSAALAAQGTGLRIVVADDQPAAGGTLLWEQQEVEGLPGKVWAEQARARLEADPDIRLLLSTRVVAAYDHGYFTAVQELSSLRSPDQGAAISRAGTAQILWKIRASKTVLASGAIERPLVFPDNDRPGIMLASAVRHYANRYAVRAGERIVVYTNNDSAYQTVFDLHSLGIMVVAVIDRRQNSAAALVQRLEQIGVPLYAGYSVSGTKGHLRLRQVELQAIHHGSAATGSSAASTDPGVRLRCDVLATSAGWSPTVHLFSQAGGALHYDPQQGGFKPAAAQPSFRAQNISVAGAANGCFGAGDNPEPAAGNAVAQTFWPEASARGHLRGRPRGRQWLDFLHDVTLRDVETAVREGFDSVEHLKRYTTAGMAIDQGKTSSVNALAALAERTGSAMGAAGTTTFRPPYHPVRLGVLAGRETGSRAWPQRRLPLHGWHVRAGGVMEDHSGWQRAAFYPQPGETEQQAIHREVASTRDHVALFDSSSLGKLEVKGPDAAEFLNRLYINNVHSLKTGCIRYGMMLNEGGIIVDDGVFARLQDDFFLVSSSSAGTAQVAVTMEEWLQTEWPELDVVVHNATGQWATLTLSGPASREVIGRVLPDIDVSAGHMPHMSLQQGERDGMAFRLMRVSFTGEMSFELNVPADQAELVWQRLLDAGAEFGIAPLGMEALDVLRTEKGFLEVGVDTDGSTCPLDVGWGVPIAKKAADFIGRRSLSQAAFIAPGRLQLVGLKPLDAPHDAMGGLPVGSHLVQADGRTEGHVTSSCLSPTLGCSIALALVRAGSERMGEQVHVSVEGRNIECQIVATGFYDPDGVRLKN